MKRCTRCQKQKPETEFYVSSRSGKPTARCRDCEKQRNRDRYAAVRGDKPDRRTRPAVPGADSNSPSEEWTEEGDRAETAKVVSSPIRTLAQLVRVCEIDLSVWDVEHYQCTAWTVSMKLKGEGGKHRAATQQNYRVFAKLKRKVPRRIERVADLLIARMRQHAPIYKAVPRGGRRAGSHLLEVSITDAHFGKLAWAEETGQSYDLASAESVYQRAVEELVNRAGGFEIDQVLFPVGSDFFNADNAIGTTTNGTPQDNDGPYIKIFQVGQIAAIKAVEYLRRVAPVKVVLVRGNHDRTTSWHLANVMRAWFRNASDIAVDEGPSQRKYIAYGQSLIGLTHGDEEKHDSLPTIMATEVPQMWADTRFREMHLGHLHKKKQTVHTAVDEHNGVVVRVLPSISGRDSWHHRKGYLGNRAADALLFSRTDGCIGQFSAAVRE